MATHRPLQYSYGEYDEIAFTSRNEMNLAVWEGKNQVRLYSYSYEDTFRERVGRFLHNGLTQIWDDHQLLDLSVRVSGQEFRCHRVVLAGVSGHFRSELTSERARSARQSGDSDTIVLDDSCVSPETFGMLLDLIYKGKDIVQDDNALDIMKAATYLRIKSLEFRCLDILVKQLGEGNCMEIWDWAEKNNIPGLASKAKGVALSFFQLLRHTEDFLRIPLERLTLMLGHELLHYRYEDDILEAILDWVQFDTTDRRQHLKELLPYVCFPYLSTKYLNELRKHELIGLRSEFAPHVDEALTFHLAALQKDGKKIQMEVLKRQAHSLKRLMPGMRRVVLLIGGAVVQDEPLTTVVACYLDMGHPQSRYREVLQFSIASLPVAVGLRFASAVWKNDVYVSGGSRSPDSLLVYKPHENAWHSLKAMPEGRHDHVMVAADGKLYVLGGRVSTKGGFKVIADVNLYDIEAKVWKPAGELPVAVEAAPAVLLADKVYVFGGRTQSGDSVGVVQRLDLVTGESHVVGMLPEPVEGAKAIVLGKDIVVVCPDGAIYTVHESSRRNRKVTFSEHHDSDEDLLSSLNAWSPKTAVPREEEEEEEKEKEEKGAQGPSQKLQAVKGTKKVDWSILDAEGTKRVPDLKRATSDEDPATLGFLQREDSTEPDHPTPRAEEVDKEKTPAAEAEHAEDDVDKHHNDNEPKSSSDVKEAESDPTQNGGEGEEEEFEKLEKADACPSEQTPDKGKADESETADGSEKTGPEDSDSEEEKEEEGEAKAKQPDKAVSEVSKPADDQPVEVIINKIAAMEPRRDFGLFIRKEDVMVVGGQSDKGFFLDDILKIHIPTGQVCPTDSKMVIPISGMQVESTTMHQNYLVQFFDAASCFYGE